MTAELVRGQNHPLSQSRLEIRVSAGTPMVAAATLGDEQGRIHGVEWVAHPGTPTPLAERLGRQALSRTPGRTRRDGPSRTAGIPHESGRV